MIQFDEFSERIIYCPQGIHNRHNRSPIEIKVVKIGNNTYVVSKSTAEFINKHFCGIPGCDCGKGDIHCQNNIYRLHSEWIVR